MERFQVDTSAIEQYRLEGATCIKGAFKDWAPRMLSAHDRLQERLEALAESKSTSLTAASVANPEPFPPLTYSRGKSGQFGIRNAVFADPDFRAWMLESPVADIIGQVIGAKSLRFWWDQSFCKTANAPPEGATPWHTDSGAFSWVGDMLPSFWIAGTDVGPENSPLLTAVASHNDKRWFRPVVGKEDVKELPENYYERDEIMKVLDDPKTEVRTWTIEKGDCLVIHPYTYHASKPPEPGAGRRIAFTSRWLGNDIRWKLREMTFTYPDDGRFQNVKQDQPPPDDGFPVIWESD